MPRQPKLSLQTYFLPTSISLPTSTPVSQSIPMAVTKVPETRWPTSNRNLLFTVLEARSPRPGWQRSRIPLRTPFWVADGHFLKCSHVVERTRGLSGVFYKALIPFRRIKDPVTSRSPISYHHHTGGYDSNMWGHINIQSTSISKTWVYQQSQFSI